MEKRKLVLTHALKTDHLKQIQEMIPDWEIISGKERTLWEPYLREAEIIAGSNKRLGETCADPESRVRWVQTWSAGINWLPLESMEARGTFLTNARGVHANPISETILALMLSLTRKIHTYVRNQQSKAWDHANMNQEMHRRTVGIVGVGAIGKETAKLCKAFGMTVLGVRRSGEPEEHVDRMFRTDELNDMLPECDYVVVTVPLTPETRRMFSAEQFRRMKPTSFFINIGRGETVDETALADALRAGSIAGAGLDVFETEPLPKDSPLWEMENVIVTPHTSGSTEYYDERVVRHILIPNLKMYLQGDIPTVNRIDYKKGY